MSLQKDEFCHSPGYAAETFVTTNCLFMVDLPATAASSQQLASRQEPTRGNINNDLFAVVNRLLQFVGALSGKNTCLTGFKSRLEGQREKSVRKQFLEVSHCCVLQRKWPGTASSINTTTDMNQPHSCPGNCSALRIIYTPLPLPESCGDSHDSEYTPGLYSRENIVYHCSRYNNYPQAYLQPLNFSLIS